VSKLSAYQLDVKNRGKLYIELPANTPLGPSVAGLPGARNYTSNSGYEVAPPLVIAEVKSKAAVQKVVDAIALYAADNPLSVTTWGSDWDYAVAQTKKTGDVIRDGVQQLNDDLPGLPNFNVVLVVLAIVAVVVALVVFAPEVKRLVRA
jgi:hypothetical protein